VVDAWGLDGSDSVPHFLPVHHLHGILNKLLAPLSVGATVSFIDPKPHLILQQLAQSATVLMGVPTIYSNLISYLEQSNSKEMDFLAKAFQRLREREVRVCICGSAPLSTSIITKFPIF